MSRRRRASLRRSLLLPMPLHVISGAITTRSSSVDATRFDDGGICERCGLTPPAAWLLDANARALSDARGNDGSWSVVRCRSCTRITTVVDHVDGSCFGEPRVVAMRDDERRPVSPRATPRRRRRRARGRLRALVAATCTVLIGGASIVGLTVAADRAIERSIGEAADAPPPMTLDRTVTELQRSSVARFGVVGDVPAGVSVGRVETLTTASTVAAVARVRNAASASPLAADVTFEVVSTDGVSVVDEYATVVVLSPGEAKTVAAHVLEVSDGSATTVRVSVRPYDGVVFPSLTVDAIRLVDDGSDVSLLGRVTNASSDAIDAIVSCAIRSSGGGLLAVATGTVVVEGRSWAPVSLSAPDLPPGDARATCSAS